MGSQSLIHYHFLSRENLAARIFNNNIYYILWETTSLRGALTPRSAGVCDEVADTPLRGSLPVGMEHPALRES